MFGKLKAFLMIVMMINDGDSSIPNIYIHFKNMQKQI